ncbi:hypothetical protein VNO78_24464 [Psophocarpus tetragonolobus]|uniref:Protein kinase domain-containing protein n=1 Tax=Psophocarpus tetragonolobus TaxID=3891 RepID=A0AAN9XEC9_PSOTE
MVDSCDTSTIVAVIIALGASDDKKSMRVRFDNLDMESAKFMAREILVLHRLDHANVIKACISPTIKFSEPQVKCYMQQLLSGLDHCHSHGVLHRSIKSSNLLIDNNDILKSVLWKMSGVVRAALRSKCTTSVCALVQRSHGLSVRCFSTETEQPPMNSSAGPPFFGIDHSGKAHGPTYGRMFGIRKHVRKTDIDVWHSKACTENRYRCNLTLEDVKMDYNRPTYGTMFGIRKHVLKTDIRLHNRVRTTTLPAPAFFTFHAFTSPSPHRAARTSLVRRHFLHISGVRNAPRAPHRAASRSPYRTASRSPRRAARTSLVRRF